MRRQQLRRVARGVSLVLVAYTAVRIATYFLDVFGTRRHHVEAGWFWLAIALALYVAAGARAPEDEPVPGASPVVVGYVMLAAMAAAWAAYVPSLGIGLLSDDFVLVARATSGSFGAHNEFFRPLPLVLWRAAQSITSASWFLHAINITLHGLVSALVGVLALRAGFGFAWALFAAFATAVQPISVEAVTWISGLQDVVATVCVLLATVLAVSDRRLAVITALLILAALLSKETAVAAPLLLAVFCVRRASAHDAWIHVAVALLCVFGYVAVRSLMLHVPETYLVTPSRYLLKELASRSFGALALPWHQRMISEHPWLATASAGAPLILLAIAIARDRVDATTVRFAAWILVAVAPVYTYFVVGPDLEGSRYLYLAVPGWALLMTELTHAALKGSPRWPAAVVCTSLLVVWAVGVVVNQGPWRTAARLRDSVLEQASLSVVANGCRTAQFEAPPDSIDGVYVFRNGFAEAARSLPSVAGGRDCRFRWNGAAFVGD